MAVIAYNGETVRARGKTSTALCYRKKSPNQNRDFLSAISAVNFDVSQTEDLQLQFDDFYNKALTLLDKIYPMKQISITSNDPSFMTPEIKAMLRRKNKLMRMGRVEEAGALAARVGMSIVKVNSAQFKSADEKIDAGDMWKKVKLLTSRSTPKQCDNDVTAAALNILYTIQKMKDRDATNEWIELEMQRMNE